MADVTIDRTEHPGPRLRWSGAVEDARGLLRTDAALCLLSGAGLAAAAPYAARLIDGQPTGLVRAIGLGLALYALDLALLSRVRLARLPVVLTAVAALSGAWLVASAVVVATGVLSVSGALIVAASGVPVVALARAQLAAAGEVRQRLETYGLVVAGRGSRPTARSRTATSTRINQQEEQR